MALTYCILYKSDNGVVTDQLTDIDIDTELITDR